MRAPAIAALLDGSNPYVMPKIAGHIIAPPMPMAPRAASKAQMSVAKPPSNEKPAKIADPMKKIRRRPNMSARRPPVTMRTPNTRA